MVKFMKKIPAGTFLVPMLLSALLYTFWPNLFNIGGVTEAFLSGSSVTFIIGMICFCSGVNIDINSLGKLFKRHGIIMIAKAAISVGASLLYMTLFGQRGILGVSALAFTVGISSINPALYISVVSDYGEKLDEAAFGLTSLFSIPALPLFIYAMAGSGEIDWMPIISTIIPLILGIILGNVDKDFRGIFGKGIGVLIPILGWNIGQGLNLIDAVQSGLGGIVLAVFYYLLMLPLVLLDDKLLKNDGMAAMAMNSVAGSSSAFPAIVVQANLTLLPYLGSATAQVLALAIITVLLTPVLSRMLYNRTNKPASA